MLDESGKTEAGHGSPQPVDHVDVSAAAIRSMDTHRTFSLAGRWNVAERWRLQGTAMPQRSTVDCESAASEVS